MQLSCPDCLQNYDRMLHHNLRLAIGFGSGRRTLDEKSCLTERWFPADLSVAKRLAEIASTVECELEVKVAGELPGSAMMQVEPIGSLSSHMDLKIKLSMNDWQEKAWSKGSRTVSN